MWKPVCTRTLPSNTPCLGVDANERAEVEADEKGRTTPPPIRLPFNWNCCCGAHPATLRGVVTRMGWRIPVDVRRTAVLIVLRIIFHGCFCEKQYVVCLFVWRGLAQTKEIISFFFPSKKIANGRLLLSQALPRCQICVIVGNELVKRTGHMVKPRRGKKVEMKKKKRGERIDFSFFWREGRRRCGRGEKKNFFLKYLQFFNYHNEYICVCISNSLSLPLSICLFHLALSVPLLCALCICSPFLFCFLSRLPPSPPYTSHE